MAIEVSDAEGATVNCFAPMPRNYGFRSTQANGCQGEKQSEQTSVWLRSTPGEAIVLPIEST